MKLDIIAEERVFSIHIFCSIQCLDEDEGGTLMKITINGTVYEAEQATVKGKSEKISIKNKAGIKFGKASSNSIQWNVSTGLAQIYALRFNYINTSGKPIKVLLQMMAANGTVLKNDEITFPETQEKWKQISTTTGTYINAGSYRVVLSGENMQGLAFDSLELQ